MKEEKRNKNTRIFDRVWAGLAIVTATILIIFKVSGRLTWSWPGVALGYVGLMCSLMFGYVVLAVGVLALFRALKRLREWKRRRKVARTLWEAMEGLTLNNIGPIYGIRRQPGEKNRSFKRRILKASRTLDTVNVQKAPTPATGQKLDAIAKKQGLRRYPHETDEQLQNRIREAVLKNLEEGERMAEYKPEAEPKAWADGVPVFCAHDAIVDVTKLVPNPKNPNQHPDNQIQLLGRIIRQAGWRQPITVSKRSGFIVKGHGRLAAALLEGMKEAPVDYQNYTTEAEEYADLVADNRIAELAETDNKLLADIFAEIDTGEIPMELTGYTEDEVENLVTALSEALHNDLSEPDEIPETPEPEETVTQKGDLWILGCHRVVCGDATNEKDRELLLNGAHPEILLTDPPYCSGGFQESGRSEGSIGTKRYDANGKEIKVTIANDSLSTRGYQSLMKQILQNFDGRVAYIFTDWRMWVYLFDVVEGSGLGVKNMLVWNKKSPGMGMGWRTQHELVMFAHRTKPKWDNHKGYGNVLEATRSGNELHPTQKPVEILEKLLDNTDWAEGVLDTFGGSGTTLIAAESVGQASFLIEMEPRFVDVIVRRYIKTTGKTSGIELIRKGKTVGRDRYEHFFME